MCGLRECGQGKKSERRTENYTGQIRPPTLGPVSRARRDLAEFRPKPSDEIKIYSSSEAASRPMSLIPA